MRFAVRPYVRVCPEPRPSYLLLPSERYSYKGLCEMAIRIVGNGNSVSKIAPIFDECVIESLVNDPNGEDVEKLSFAMDIRNGQPIYKRIRSDEETSEFISDLYNNEEIADIKMDEKNHDLVIYLRELGQDALDIGEIPPTNSSV